MPQKSQRPPPCSPSLAPEGCPDHHPHPLHCEQTLICFLILLSQVKIWFQNRRMKWRNSKERELLSSGGCREQTLPTKLNPHPDLSDVGQKGPGDEEEDSPGARLTYHAPPDPRHLLEGPLPASPAHSSSPGKPSDFSDSDEDEEGEEDEEITVS